ncbi:MAG: tRNA pseudouridine(38-40) synthase TruA [Myxococcales bacterium]
MDARRSVWVLHLAYDGGEFRGWQRQPGLHTVQGALEAALASLAGRPVAVHGAARTDAGVHARGQIAHFAAAPAGPHGGVASLPCGEGFLDALRLALPASLRATRVALAPRSFHARSTSVGKRYSYRFRWGPRAAGDTSEPAFDLGAQAGPDWERARSALAGLDGLPLLPGLASPSTDRRPAPGLQSWSLQEAGGVATLIVRAGAFRKHQVRNLAGHLAAVALGLAAPGSLAALAARRRPWMGATAPPHGLCLEQVLYPAEEDPFRDGR